MSDPHRGWVKKSSCEKVPGKGTTGAEVSGRERPVEAPNGEKETKPSCATPDCAGDAGARSSYKVKVGAGDTDEASDEEHQGPETALPHPSDILMSDPHRGKVPGAGDTDEASDEEHRGPGAALPHPSDILMSDTHHGKVPGAGDTDEATDEEHRGPGAALPHPSDI